MPITSEREFLSREFNLLNDNHQRIYSLDTENVDITIYNTQQQVMCWLEGKKEETDIYKMLSQIIFTAYRIKKQDYSNLPPYFGCYDGKKGALIKSIEARQVFEFNDINWNQAPSNVDNKTIETIKRIIQDYVVVYPREEFLNQIKLIHEDREIQKINITKSNFNVVYQEWYIHIGQLLDLSNYKDGKKLLPDFYLADLMYDKTQGSSVCPQLSIVVYELSNGKMYYENEKQIGDTMARMMRVFVKDVKRYKNFWNRFNRPPAEEYREYILTRRDLLQPSNIREIKGAFFTPAIWSAKSKEGIAQALGDDWQDKYYIWDCCCGTGNLESGLYRQDRVFMSTLDQQDIDTMHQNKIMQDAVKFQFDFLNDEWKPISEGGKLPDKLFNIIKTEPQNIVVYINPPYVEATNCKTISGTGEHREVAYRIQEFKKTVSLLYGKCSNEMFIQFWVKAHQKINGCIIASFSTLKYTNGKNFVKFRKQFNAIFISGFIVPANTFDNVSGNFPIGFTILRTNKTDYLQEKFKFSIYKARVSEEKYVKNKTISTTKEILDYQLEGEKTYYQIEDNEFINDWLLSYSKNKWLDKEAFGFINTHHGNGVKDGRVLWFQDECDKSCYCPIVKANIAESLIYLCCFKVFQDNWLTHEDNFTEPFYDKTQDKLKHYHYSDDKTFISNCIIYALFTKNYTTWALFKCSELDINNDGTRDMEIWSIITQHIGNDWENNDDINSPEGREVLRTARELYRFYYTNTQTPKLTASWNDIIDTIKGKKIDEKGNIGRRNTSCVDYPEAQSIMDNLSKSLYNLSLLIQEGAKKYGFLRS